MRHRRIVAWLVTAGLASGGLSPMAVGSAALAAPPRQATAPQPPSAPGISGLVLRDDRKTRVSDVRLRLRNLDKITTVGQTVSRGDGTFSFSVAEPGLYVVEALNDDNGVLAVSGAVNFLNSPAMTIVILPARRGAAAFFTSSAFLIVSAAAGAGILAWAVTKGDDSPQPVSPER